MPGEAGKPPSLGPLALGALALLVLACRGLATHAFPIYDDAFITFRYAQNLAAGHGLVFNPGAEWEPVLGTTTPGYAVLLAFCVRLGCDVVGASLALNAVCDAVSAWLLARLLRDRPTAAVIALAAFAAVPEIARVSAGGMEAPVLVCLALGAVAAAHASWFVCSGLLAALACAIRPEAVLLVAALAAFHVRSRRQAALFFAPVVALGLAYAATLTWYFGDPIPQSIKAKAEFYGLGPRLARAGAILVQAFGSSLPARSLAPLALLGFALVFVWKTALRAFVAFALVMVLAYAASGAKTWGWYFYAPLTAWCVALGLACDAALEFAVRARSSLAPWPARVRVAAVLAALAAVALWSRLRPDQVTPRVYANLRVWCESNRIAERGATICASDIGAIGFYSRARILDSEGLVWPEGRTFARQVDVVRASLPDYVMLVVNQARVPPFVADPIAARYQAVARFNTRRESDLLPAIDALPDRWEQDYLMFARRD